ncbi:MAG: phosphate/phosphite/phosphonate ABC transporter substrate-binding protein [Rubrobacter sp.]|nr:phosphate/phosphite/phosphonate ABC transporter substrate-binding protein [Rubrobacter sp.]
MIHRLSTLVLVTVAAIVLASCGGGGGGGGSASGDEPLRVGLIPNENPEEVEAQYQPLEDYLKKELGREVELSVPTTYNGVVEAMVSGELDLAYFGGLTYVQARQRADVHPLFTEVNPSTGTTKYRSVIIVPADSDIEKVEDLEGEDFAFGSVSSTSGSLYPSIMLDQAGLDYRTDLGEVVYTGGHDTTAQAVANGRVAAGGLEDRILYGLQEEGIIEKSEVRVIGESDPIEGYPWVVRDALSDKDDQDLTDAFLGIEDPELLDLLRAEDYQKVQAGDYDYVEEQARKLDLIAEEQ